LFGSCRRSRRRVKTRRFTCVWLFFFLPLFSGTLYLCQYCHCHTLTGIIRTAVISSFDCHHCHPATATRSATATPSLPHLPFLHKSTSILPLFFSGGLYLCQYCHPHILTTTIRTALISSVDCHHRHPTTATPHSTATPQPPGTRSCARTFCR
jgi:hypothetical protein